MLFTYKLIFFIMIILLFRFLYNKVISILFFMLNINITDKLLIFIFVIVKL